MLVDIRGVTFKYKLRVANIQTTFKGEHGPFLKGLYNAWDSRGLDSVTWRSFPVLCPWVLRNNGNRGHVGT